MIWIIGEYAERIDNADELLESFLESFPEEPAHVQLQLLTATVKLFLKKPTEGPQQMIQVLLLYYPHLLSFLGSILLHTPYSLLEFVLSFSKQIFFQLDCCSIMQNLRGKKLSYYFEIMVYLFIF